MMKTSLRRWSSDDTNLGTASCLDSRTAVIFACLRERRGGWVGWWLETSDFGKGEPEDLREFMNKITKCFSLLPSSENSDAIKRAASVDRFDSSILNRSWF